MPSTEPSEKVLIAYISATSLEYNIFIRSFAINPYSIFVTFIFILTNTIIMFYHVSNLFLISQFTFSNVRLRIEI